MERYLYYNLIEREKKLDYDSQSELNSFKDNVEIWRHKIIKNNTKKTSNIVKAMWEEVKNAIGLDYAAGCYNYQWEKSTSTILKQGYPENGYPDSTVCIKPSGETIEWSTQITTDRHERISNSMPDFSNQYNLYYEAGNKIRVVVKMWISGTVLSTPFYEFDVINALLYRFFDKEKLMKLETDDDGKIININTPLWKQKFNYVPIDEVILDFQKKQRLYPFKFQIESNTTQIFEYYYPFELEALLNEKYARLYKKGENKTGNDKEYQFRYVYNIVGSIMKTKKVSHENLGQEYITSYLMERTIGFNLAITIFYEVTKRMEEDNRKTLTKSNISDVKDIIRFIMKFPNTFGRLELVETVFLLYFSYLKMPRTATKTNFIDILEDAISIDTVTNNFAISCYIMDHMLGDTFGNIKDLVVELNDCIRKIPKVKKTITIKGIWNKSLFLSVKGHFIKESNREDALYVEIQKTIINEILEHSNII